MWRGETWTYHVIDFQTDVLLDGINSKNQITLMYTALIYMSWKFKIRDQEAVHFVTFTTVYWLDPPGADNKF